MATSLTLVNGTSWTVQVLVLVFRFRVWVRVRVLSTLC
jgi:hypothetical protein